MTLKDYFKLKDTNATQLAQALGVAPSTLIRAADGTTIPSRDLMTRIFEATGGTVTPNDFFGIAA